MVLASIVQDQTDRFGIYCAQDQNARQRKKYVVSKNEHVIDKPAEGLLALINAGLAFRGFSDMRWYHLLSCRGRARLCLNLNRLSRMSGS